MKVANNLSLQTCVFFAEFIELIYLQMSSKIIPVKYFVIKFLPETNKLTVSTVVL